MNVIKEPPHNIEAESALIGCLVVRFSQIGDVNVILHPDDFYSVFFRKCYVKLLEFSSEGAHVDGVILVERMRQNAASEEERREITEKLFDAISTAPSVAAAIDYAKIIRTSAIRRKIISLSMSVSRKSSEGIDPNGELDALAELGKRLNSESDVKDYTEDSCWKAFKVKPVPSSELAALVDKPVPYLINPLVVAGSLTQIQGQAKGGKSTFALFIASCAAHNIWPQPEFIKADRALRVLYLAWEDPAIMMAKRLALYNTGLGLDRKEFSDNLIFMFAPEIFVDKGDQAALLTAAIRHLKADIVIIDTLSHIHMVDDENSASGMKIPMRHLMRIGFDTGAGIVYAHHTGKGADDRSAQDKARGSTAIAAAWHVCVDWGRREEGSDINPVIILSKYEHQWMNWEITYIPEKDPDGNVTAVKWSIQAKEIKAKEESSADKKRRAIMDSLAALGLVKDWILARDVADQCGLGMDERSVRRLLQKYVQEGYAASRADDEGRALYRKA